MTEYQPFTPVGGPVMVPAPGFAPPPPPGYQPMQVAPPYRPQLTDDGDALATPDRGRRPSRLGGRPPLIALVLVLLLGAVGAAYGIGMFSKKAPAPAPIVHRTKPAVVALVASTPAVVAPVKPVAKRPVAKRALKPLAGKTLRLTRVNSGTYSEPYSVLVPTGWATEFATHKHSRWRNNDIFLTNKPGLQLYTLLTLAHRYPSAGPVTRATFLNVKAEYVRRLAKVGEKATPLPGEITLNIAGEVAYGWDRVIPSPTSGSTRTYTERAFIFQHAGRVHLVSVMTRTDLFPAALPVFNQLLTTVKFAK